MRVQDLFTFAFFAYSAVWCERVISNEVHPLLFPLWLLLKSRLTVLHLACKCLVTIRVLTNALFFALSVYYFALRQSLTAWTKTRQFSFVLIVHV